MEKPAQKPKIPQHTVMFDPPPTFPDAFTHLTTERTMRVVSAKQARRAQDYIAISEASRRRDDVWLATLAVGNGGGMLQLLNVVTDAQNKLEAVNGYYSSLWMFASGIVLAGVALHAARRKTFFERRTIEIDATHTDILASQLHAVNQFQQTAGQYPDAVKILEAQYGWFPKVPGTEGIDIGRPPQAWATTERAELWRRIMEGSGYASALAFVLGVAWPLVTLRVPSQSALATAIVVARDWLPTLLPVIFGGLGFLGGLYLRKRLKKQMGMGD